MTLRARLAIGAYAASVALAGCGGGGAEPEEPATPDAVASNEPTELTRPAKPERLRLPDKGSPTVTVRLKRQVKLYEEPDGKVVGTVGHSTEFGSRTVYSVSAQKDGWAAVLTPYSENGEPLWVELDPGRLKAGRSNLGLEVDLSEFETRLYEEGKLVRSFPVSIGMPTAPTPTGRFAITDTIRGGLNEAYGCCALAMTARQVNLPSGWLGGDRIALHGTSGEIGAEISHGCVRAADEDVSALVDAVPLGTPVEIHE